MLDMHSLRPMVLSWPARAEAERSDGVRNLKEPFVSIVRVLFWTLSIQREFSTLLHNVRL